MSSAGTSVACDNASPDFHASQLAAVDPATAISSPFFVRVDEVARLHKALEDGFRREIDTLNKSAITSPPKTESVISLINKIDAIKSKEASGMAKRNALFPIVDEEGFRFYKMQQVESWVADEFDFSVDIKDYQGLPAEQRKIVDAIMAFFLVGDGLISQNIAYRFLLECKTFEESAFFIEQLRMELIHAETYGMAMFTMLKDEKTMNTVMNDIENSPYIKAKTEFMEKYMLADLPREDRLVAFACAEGIFFMALFGFVFWFRSKGKMSNFISANEKIAKDESIHCMRAVSLYHREVKERDALLAQLSKDPVLYEAEMKKVKNARHERVLAIIKEAVAIEELFIHYLLPQAIEDLSHKSMGEYVKSIADNLLDRFNCPAYYKSKSPFTWDTDALLPQKTNFYEARSMQYSNKSLKDVLAWRKKAGKEAVKKVDPIANPSGVDF